MTRYFRDEDASLEQRSEWQRLTGVPAYDSYDALLEEGAPDVVIVATPPESHADLALRALDSGAHVICDAQRPGTNDEFLCRFFLGNSGAAEGQESQSQQSEIAEHVVSI